jgi:hypothetical protein
MSKWFRWYEGTTEDGKFRVTARNAGVTVATVIGVWAILLEDASNDEHRGLALRGCDFYAAILDISEGDIQNVLQCMEDVGMISAEAEFITILNWKERQFESDATDGTNAIRQRRYRERRNALPNRYVTARNGRVTARNGSVTERVTVEQNGHSENMCDINVHVTPLRNGHVTATKRPDTDTDTDKKDTCALAKASRSKHAYSEQFEEAWQAYPRRDGANPKPPAAKRFLAAVKAGTDPPAIIEAVKRFAVAEAKNVGTPFIPQMVKWLKDERWLDYDGTVIPIKFDVRRHLV